MNGKVVIILLNYNRPIDTLQCIDSLMEIEYSDYSILIIDNCSTDTSVKILQNKHATIPIYITPQNLGYTGGINFGIKKALLQNPEYVLVLNNDTIVAKDFLKQLVNGIKLYPKAAAACGTIISEHDRRTVWYAGGKIVPWRGLAIHNNKGKFYDALRLEHPQQVTFLTGCSILFNAKCFADTGLEDERFFLYLDDIEFSLRMMRKGFQLIFVPSSVIFHKTLGENDSAYKLYYSVRNRLLLIHSSFNIFWKYVATIYFFFVISVKLIFWKFKSEKFYRAAKYGLIDFFTKKFYEGRGIKLFYDENKDKAS